MTGRAIVGKQLGGRFALIEILSMRQPPDHDRDCTRGKKTSA
jgi:hypothetical protein